MLCQVLSLASAEISAGALRSCLSSLPSELKAGKCLEVVAFPRPLIGPTVGHRSHSWTLHDFTEYIISPSLVPRQVLDLSDTAADVQVVRAVIQHERFKLTHFRLCRCTRMDNLMLSDILWRIYTLEAR